MMLPELPVRFWHTYIITELWKLSIFATSYSFYWF